MDMTGEYQIPASRSKVWDALNDPEILKQCIPGCEEIEKLSATEMTAKVRAKVGPVSARFSGKVTLSARGRAPAAARAARRGAAAGHAATATTASAAGARDRGERSRREAVAGGGRAGARRALAGDLGAGARRGGPDSALCVHARGRPLSVAARMA